MRRLDTGCAHSKIPLGNHWQRDNGTCFPLSCQFTAFAMLLGFFFFFVVVVVVVVVVGVGFYLAKKICL